MFKTEITKINLGGSNSYLLKCKDGSILVDTGLKDAAKKLKKELSVLNMKPEDIILIVITHNHYDHTQGLEEIKKMTKAPVMIHKAELDNDGIGDDGYVNNSSMLFKIIVKAVGKLMPANETVTIKADVEIADEYDLRKYGVDARIIHTPGHSPGSVCIVTGDRQCIAGDTLFNMFPGTHYPIIVYDKKELIKTYRLLDEIDSLIYYPGHGKAITRKAFKKKIMNRKKYFITGGE